MKIAVIGAGALGTFYCTMIAASNEDTTLVCRERDVETLKKGITVTGDMEKSARPARYVKAARGRCSFHHCQGL